MRNRKELPRTPVSIDSFAPAPIICTALLAEGPAVPPRGEAGHSARDPAGTETDSRRPYQCTGRKGVRGFVYVAGLAHPDALLEIETVVAVPPA
jgi:hypothetical protein